MHLCQAVVRRAIKEVGIPDSAIIEDGQQSPSLSSPASVAAAAYVDNFFVFSLAQSVADEYNERIASQLREWGLPVHEVEPASKDMSFVGLDAWWQVGVSQEQVHLASSFRSGGSLEAWSLFRESSAGLAWPHRLELPHSSRGSHSY